MTRRLALIVVLAAAVAGAVLTSLRGGVPGDFLRYHRAGRLVVTGRADKLYDERFLASQAVYAGERTPGGDKLEEDEFKYAPAFAVAMAPFGALPPRPAAIAWGALNGALIAAMFLAARRWCGDGLSTWWMLVPLVVLFRPVRDNLALGQVNPSAIVPATIGLALVARGRDAAGGALVGLGAAVKYVPAVLFVWLAWKRRWRALVAALGAALLFLVVLPAAALGPAKAFDATAEWLAVRAHHYGAGSGDDLPGYSVKSLVYRALGDTPYEARVEREDGEREKVTVGIGIDSVPRPALYLLTMVLDAALLGVVLWATRRKARAPPDPDASLEAGAALALLLLVSPEARFPHFLYLALPLTALTYALVRGRASPRFRPACALAAAGALLVNVSTFVPKAAAPYAEAWCVPGIGAATLVASMLVLRTMPRVP